MKFNAMIPACLFALGIGAGNVATGEVTELEDSPVKPPALGALVNETNLEGSHAELEPIQLGTHSSGHPITIKTISMNPSGNLLVGISWGEGKMEFAQPRESERGRGDQQRFRDSGAGRRPGGFGGMMRRHPVLVTLDENEDGEISNNEIEKAEESLAKLDKNRDGKLTGSELRPGFGQGGRPFGDSQRDRRPSERSDGRLLDTEKSGEEIDNILEFGTEEEIVELARQTDPRSFFEAIRGMSSDDRRKVMSALPEDIRGRFRSRFGGQRFGDQERGRGGGRNQRGSSEDGRPERRGNRGPLTVDDLYKHQYGIRVIGPEGSLMDEWPMPDDGPHPKMIHCCEDGTVYVAGHGKLASYNAKGKRIAMTDIDELHGQKALASGMFVGHKHVFLAIGMGNSMRATQDIYRFHRDLTGAKLIIEQQYGCCSHIDMQVMNGELLIAENSRHRVNRFDLDGNPLGRWGKRDRRSIEGFAACCNPVNIDIGPDNILYTAESGVGRIKKYTPEGEFLGVVGYVDTTEFDRGGRLAAQTCYIPIEVSPDANRVYVVDVRANLIRVLAPKEK